MTVFRTFEVSEPHYGPDHIRFVTLSSAALGRRADIAVYNAGATTPNVPVVYLLHGVYGSHWAWLFSGGVHLIYERLRRDEGLSEFVLAMPSDGLHGDGSGYFNRRCGRFEDWIVDEVPAAVARVVPGVTPLSRSYIAGLSMGGYGALRIGARHPRQFAGISGHSPITAIPDFEYFTKERPDIDLIDPTTETDLARLLIARAGAIPPLRFDCGSDDMLLASARTLHTALTDAGIAHEYDEPAGGHEWPYWTRQIAVSLRFFDRIERSARLSGPAVA
jgi:putative tributyrin esterase